eukprot:TRINITY_DN1968_c0_g1_i1.p1 TRINITY_DN1968_c0_g1~~TRINITY_DN1968_c0_g1_i1.p1  ORF type:complete len:548 (+),score=159.09 TRINITY_DN1968_c0_g1_i1:50-1693(+)
MTRAWACIVLVAAAAHLCSAATLWPQPSYLSVGTSSLFLNPLAFSVSANVSSSVLNAAISRYYNASTAASAPSLFFPFTGSAAPPGSSPTVSVLAIGVVSSSESLQLGTDESYSLTVPASGGTATAQANTIFGAMRALESFSQLIDFDTTSLTYSIDVAPVSVNDAPRFSWRGVLIDTARHYLNVPTIKRAIEALSYSKFNTLHWHAVDAESFPVEVDAYPELANKGAYAPSAVFDVDDIEHIQQYALQHGVRLVMEFDMPGHAYSWGKGYPNLTVSCPNYEANINNIPLDPTQQFTYDVILGVMQAVSAHTPDNYWHIGGDEVVTGCWMENTNVTSWMQQHGISSSTQLLQYFETNMQKVLANVGKKPVVWEDLFDAGIQLSPDTIVEIWDGSTTLKKVVQAGLQAINAYGWYLNEQVPIAGQEVGQWVDTWKTFYGYDPLDGLGLSPAQEALVLGGEAAMWGEQVDSVNFDSRVWPRACAIAERLWSPSGITDVNLASPRLQEHRCRLARRAIGAGPIVPDYCALPEDVSAMRRRLARKQHRKEF